MTSADSSTGSALHVTELGQGPRVVLVHGAMTSGERAWTAQRPLADAWRLVIPDRRGFCPNPPADRCDFEVDAGDVEALLEDGAHLVGHSYGGLVAMLLAQRRPDLVHSLTLIEPAAHALALESAVVQDTIRRYNRLPFTGAPEDFLDSFLAFLGAPPGRRRPMSLQTAQHVGMAMHERPPWTARLTAAQLAKHRFPVLVLTGGRGDVFDVVADAAATAYASDGTERYPVERTTLDRVPHDAQRAAPDVNPRLHAFWTASEAERTPS